jgi:hypothetical protein
VFGLPLPLTSASTLSFEVSITFGEGELLALVDPETSKVDKIIYDAESTSGSLILGEGYETTIVWTRTSGATGPLVGQAITSDGDVIGLSIEPARAGSEQPFVLFYGHPRQGVPWHVHRRIAIKPMDPISACSPQCGMIPGKTNC